MKKALIALLALACLSALSYADGVTVGMDFGRSQFDLASNSGVSGADTMQGWGPGPSGTWPPGQRMDIQLAWSNDHAAVNLTGYIMNGNSATSPSLDFVNDYGTLKIVPDMAKIIVGRFAGDGFDAFRHDSPHPIHDMDNNSIGRFSGWGIIADVAPKDSGFEGAVAIMADDPTKGIQQSITNAVSNYQFGASYTVPNLIKITAGSTTFNNLYPVSDRRNVFGAVDLLMVPNLTLWDTFWYKGFDVSPSLTQFSDELAGQYVMDKLTIVLAAFYASDNTLGTSSVASSIAVYPEVYYNLGMITVGLYAGYALDMLQGQSNNGSQIDVEPYIVLNDFGVRISLHYVSVTPLGATTSTGSWEIPVIVTWGF